MSETVTVNGVVYTRVPFLRVEPTRKRAKSGNKKQAKNFAIKQSNKRANKYKTELLNRLTPSEKKFNTILREASKVIPSLNYKQQYVWRKSSNSRHFFIVDFLIKSPVKIAIEIDGGYHSTQRIHDQFRDSQLAKDGISTYRFTNEQVLNRSGDVLSRVIEILTT